MDTNQELTPKFIITGGGVSPAINRLICFREEDVFDILETNAKNGHQIIVQPIGVNVLTADYIESLKVFFDERNKPKEYEDYKLIIQNAGGPPVKEETIKQLYELDMQRYKDRWDLFVSNANKCIK